MNVTAETFDRDVIERSRELPVVVDFWAAWCAPCRTLGPAIEAEVAKREGKLELAKLNVEAEPQIASRYGIKAMPMVAVFRDGEILAGFVGAYPPARIARFLNEQVLSAEAGQTGAR